MVEYTLELDAIFGSLADPTRRDILRRVSRRSMSIGEIAQHYDMTFAAISKHLKLLEHAKLIIKKRRGKEKIVALSPAAFNDAQAYFKYYERLWNERFDALEIMLIEEV